VLDDDPLDDLRDVFAVVDRLFEQCVDVLPLQDFDRLAPSSKRPAMADRLIRSPSFSSRWTSITNLSMSLKPRRLLRAW